MSLQQVHLDRIAPQPWKNGGGSTRVLLTWPHEADWRLRVSVATIDRDGPFSPFPGVQRWFSVLDGEGVVLTLGGQRHLLAPGHAPFHFEGEAAPGCELVAGSTEDLNFMVPMAQGRGEMWLAEPEAEWLHRAAWRGCFAADATTLQIDDTDVAALRPGTLIWSDHAQRQRWRLRPADPLAGRAWWLAYEATA